MVPASNLGEGQDTEALEGEQRQAQGVARKRSRLALTTVPRLGSGVREAWDG